MLHLACKVNRMQRTDADISGRHTDLRGLVLFECLEPWHRGIPADVTVMRRGPMPGTLFTRCHV
jgi:hypothetical protein